MLTCSMCTIFARTLLVERGDGSLQGEYCVIGERPVFPGTAACENIRPVEASAASLLRSLAAGSSLHGLAIGAPLTWPDAFSSDDQGVALQKANMTAKPLARVGD